MMKMSEPPLASESLLQLIDDDFESLYEKADLALYQSKENGKNQYNVFESCFLK